MTTLIDQRVQECRDGSNPKTILRVTSGWVVLGDIQFLRGYTLLLPDPVVPDLNALNKHQREVYLYEATVVGDALLNLTDAYRINYEILGNSEPSLHTHIFPRYRHEQDHLRTGPAWAYDWQAAPQFDLDRDGPLMKKIANYLKAAGIDA